MVIPLGGFSEVFAAAVPVSGAMAGDLPEHETPPAIQVRGFHGAEDEVVKARWVQYTIEQMREQGWNVTFKIYPDVGHAIGREAKDVWRGLLRDLAAQQRKSASNR